MQVVLWVVQVLLATNIPVNVVLLALAAFVAYGRWSVVPIRPRSASPTTEVLQ